METVSSRLDMKTLHMFEELLKQKRSEVVRILVDNGKRALAIELYKQKKVSLGLGSRLAGVPLSEFIDMLGEHNAYLNLEVEDVKQALKTAREVL